MENSVVKIEEMGDISKELRSWIVEIEETTRNMQSQEDILWKAHCIYKVPTFRRELNPRAFTPIFVSFGPFHHDNTELKELEVHKKRALCHFLQRINHPLQNIVQEVSKNISELRDAYCNLDEKWKTNDEEFLKMMIIDGCFVLEVLQLDNESGYSDIDPCFSRTAAQHKLPYIRRDMLLIENQLPLSLLKTLVAFESLSHEEKQNIDFDHYINNLILDFVAEEGREADTTTNTTLGLHALDLYRRSLLSPEPEPPQTRSELEMDTVPILDCAVKLHEAGVIFEKSKTKSLKDIHFSPKTGKFQLPNLTMNDSTECTILNIMAFEYLHSSVDPTITSYICIMDELINSASDVGLLCEKELIFNNCGSNEEVAEVLNRIGKEVVVPYDQNLGHVRRNVSDYCRMRMNRWRANLIDTHFSSPWSVLLLVGALLVITLTVIQTVYTVLQYYHPV